MNSKWVASAFVCMTLVYCGGGNGGSGIDGNKTIGALDEAEAEDLCEYLASVIPRRTVECDGITINFGIDPDELEEEIAECTMEISALDTCNATVNEAESCAEGNAAQINDLSDDEICDLLTSENPPPPPAACQALEDPSCDT